MRDKYGTKIEWVACEICGKYRYVRIIKGEPESLRCNKCTNVDVPIWFPPWAIKYNLLQLQYFLLPNIIMLRDGNYPGEPDEYRVWKWGGWVRSHKSSYIGGRSNKLNPKGNHIIPVEIASEIDARIDLIERYPVKLETCTEYVDGILLERKFTWNEEFKDNILHYEADKMLSFVSGWERKKTTFLKWRN